MDVSETFAEWVEREHERLVTHPTRKVGARVVAEDIAQQTWLRLWLHRDRIHTYSRSLLYLSARQRMIEYYRTRKHQVPLDVLEYIGAECEGLRLVERRLEVEDALAGLPPRDRELVLLKAEGATVSQIAKALSIPRGTVQSRTHTLHTRKTKPRGEGNYVYEILECVFNTFTHVTVSDLIVAIGMGEEDVKGYLRRLVKRGVVHKIGTEGKALGGRALWAKCHSA